MSHRDWGVVAALVLVLVAALILAAALALVVLGEWGWSR